MNKIVSKTNGNVAQLNVGQKTVTVTFIGDGTFSALVEGKTFVFNQRDVAEDIADLLDVSTNEVAQICAAISGIEVCSCGRHLAAPAHFCPPRYHILGDKTTCNCCGQCEAYCRTCPQ